MVSTTLLLIELAFSYYFPSPSRENALTVDAGVVVQEPRLVDFTVQQVNTSDCVIDDGNGLGIASCSSRLNTRSESGSFLKGVLFGVANASTANFSVDQSGGIYTSKGCVSRLGNGLGYVPCNVLTDQEGFRFDLTPVKGNAALTNLNRKPQEGTVFSLRTAASDLCLENANGKVVFNPCNRGLTQSYIVYITCRQTDINGVANFYKSPGLCQPYLPYSEISRPFMIRHVDTNRCMFMEPSGHMKLTDCQLTYDRLFQAGGGGSMFPYLYRSYYVHGGCFGAVVTKRNDLAFSLNGGFLESGYGQLGFSPFCYVPTDDDQINLTTCSSDSKLNFSRDYVCSSIGKYGSSTLYLSTFFCDPTADLHYVGRIVDSNGNCIILNGTTPSLVECDLTSTNQIYDVETHPHGELWFRNRKNSLCLTTEFGLPADKDNCLIDKTEHLWHLQSDNTIFSPSSQKCLTSSGTNVSLDSSCSTKFSIEKICVGIQTDGSLFKYALNGDCPPIRIKNSQSTKCLQTQGTLSDCTNKDDQIFDINSKANGGLLLRSVQSRKCITYSSGGLTFDYCNRFNTNQVFFLDQISNTGNALRVVVDNSNLCLTFNDKQASFAPCQQTLTQSFQIEGSTTLLYDYGTGASVGNWTISGSHLIGGEGKCASTADLKVGGDCFDFRIDGHFVIADEAHIVYSLSIKPPSAPSAYSNLNDVNWPNRCIVPTYICWCPCIRLQ